MAYLPAERAELLARRSSDPRLTPGWELDLDRYLRHERVKSAVVDSVRYAKLVAAGCSAELETLLVGKLASKLGAAHEVWAGAAPPGPDEVRAILRSPELNPRPGRGDEPGRSPAPGPSAIGG